MASSACLRPTVSLLQSPAQPPSSSRQAIPQSSLLCRHSSRALLRASPAAAAQLAARRTAAPQAPAGRGRPGACRALFGLGLPELLVIGGVAVVLFGPKQLPEIGKSLGKTVKGFQEAAKEFQVELKEATKGDSTDTEAAPGAATGAAPVVPSAEKPAQTPAEGAKEEAKK